MKTLQTYHDLTINENKFACQVRIDPEHDIFKGHFPSKPLLPGVCMIQMMVQALSLQLGRQYEVKSASTIKFINMWLPEMHQAADLSLTFEQEEQEVWIKNCVISAEGQPFFKFKGRLHAK